VWSALDDATFPGATFAVLLLAALLWRRLRPLLWLARVFSRG
jgi:hypothetical protein